MHTNELERQIQERLQSGDLQQSRSLVYHWLTEWQNKLSPNPSRLELCQPSLWRCLADVAERTSDHFLVERFWQALDKISPPKGGTKQLPLLGIPILNGFDLLERLLETIDYPVDTLAIVDNSPNSRARPSDVTKKLEALQQLGHPLIRQIRIAKPFSNMGVAASWNLILSSFPEAPIALIANHDIVFTPGVIAEALRLLNTNHPQFLPLLPPPYSFSAFLMTTLAWDRLGLFDPGFHPAYCEDLDYRDRIRADPNIEQVDGTFAHGSMTVANPNHSATIKSDSKLAEQNKISFQLNRLWYLSHRRIRQDPRGTWRRLWLAQWSESAWGDPATPNDVT